MTLCCFDIPNKYSPVDSGAPYGGGNGYPGSRPYNNSQGNYQQQPMFMPTGGNALQAYDPNASSAAGGVAGSQMVQVIVPDGSYPGQVLHVTVPDGSGRVVAATVPPGLSPGAVFMVECPAAAPGGSANLPIATPVSYPSQVPQQQAVTTATPYYPPQQQIPTTATSYYPPQQNQQVVQAQPYNYGQQHHNYNQSRPTSASGGGVAPIIAGVAGAAMLAGAAGLAYEHFHHDQDNTEYVDNVYNDDGGGFGGDY